MNTVEWVVSTLEKVGDRANPILVKETRQALKSRQFVSTFLLLLLASWVASVIGIVWFGNALEFGQAGRTFFGVFYCVLAVAILVIVPFGAFRSLLGERDENTWELLSITALTPRQIVWGKLLSALVQVFIYYSAIAPFIAFTSLLQGFDFAQVTYLLVLLLVVALGYTMTALLLSTQARQKHTQVFMTLGMLVLAGNGFFGFLGIVFSTFSFVPFDDRDFWLGNAIFLVAFISYFILFLQIATANLTFESDNRSTAVRITLSAQFWLYGIAIFFISWYSGSIPNAEEVCVIATFPAIHWGISGLIASTETEKLSRRIQRGLPQRRWARILLAPFLPGASRGYFYSLLHIAALWAIVVFLVPLFLSVSLTSSPSTLHQWLGDAGVYTTALCCYLVIYLGLAAFLSRIAQRIGGELKPGVVRFITILIICMGMLIPLLYRIVQRFPQWEFSLIDLLMPFPTLNILLDHSSGAQLTASIWTKWIISVLALTAVVAVIVNLRFMQQGVVTVVSNPLAPASPAENPLAGDSALSQAATET